MSIMYFLCRRPFNGRPALDPRAYMTADKRHKRRNPLSGKAFIYFAKVNISANSWNLML